LFGLEPLWKKYGVDLAIWAHEHSYERLWPLYDKKVNVSELFHNLTFIPPKAFPKTCFLTDCRFLPRFFYRPAEPSLRILVYAHPNLGTMEFRKREKMASMF
jgi:hypothetical protein